MALFPSPSLIMYPNVTKCNCYFTSLLSVRAALEASGFHITLVFTEYWIKCIHPKNCDTRSPALLKSDFYFGTL